MKKEEEKYKKYPQPSTPQKWICPNCGKVEIAYWGQCLMCGSQLNKTY